ncbi:MAG: hypothetical protein J6Q22_10960 [Prevotella sp.]|nr:hypothetical protein [Prevotella sp.]
MKIEVFNEELNAKCREVRLTGERIKEKMLEILQRLHLSRISDGSWGFMDEDTELLLMMLQIVWNEKEELAEKLKRLEEDYPLQGMNDHVTIGFSGLNE